MSTTQPDVLTQATAIIDAELARVGRRHAMRCTAIALLLLVAAALMITGVSQRTPLPYAGGIVAFTLALVLARRTPEPPRDND